MDEKHWHNFWSQVYKLVLFLAWLDSGKDVKEFLEDVSKKSEN